MDFQPQIKYTLPSGVPLPFFMAYPDYLKGTGLMQEKDLWKDMEYLRQMYPTKLRKYEKRVEDILDKIDYEGSMIYDEYPDKLGLQMLSRAVAKELDRSAPDEMTETMEQGCREDRETLQALTQVLVCQEICRRRSKKRKYY